MKILINLNSLKVPLTGIGHYTKNIVKELLKSEHELSAICGSSILKKEEISFYLDSFETEIGSKKSGLKSKAVELIRSIPGAYFIKHKLLSFKLRNTMKSLSNEGYVYFEPSFVPLEYDGKIITTVHDLSFISYPEFHPEERVKYLTSMLGRTVEKSDLIMVDSDFIAGELNTCYSKNSDKVKTLYLGVDESFSPESLNSDLMTLEELNLKKDGFILSVGTLEPRKNLVRMLKAYVDLPQELRKAYPLVIVGDKGWKNSELESILSPLIANGEVRQIGYVNNDTLRCLFRSAAVFAYPSLYEGFGLPVIEAMSSGTPVLTSGVGATKEVAGQSACLVDPLCIDSISEGLLKLLSDKDLRGSMREGGLLRAKQYSWKKCSDELIKYMEELSK